MSTTTSDTEFVVLRYDAAMRRSDMVGPWFVTKPPGKFYLHRDGVWRRSTAIDTRHPDGSFTVDYRGYYESEPAARAALDAAIAAGNLPPR